MKKIMIVDDNYLSAEGIEKNIDWETLISLPRVLLSEQAYVFFLQEFCDQSPLPGR